MEQYNDAHSNRRLEQTTELGFDLDLITGENESELKLTEKGIERCKQQNQNSPVADRYAVILFSITFHVSH